jgi:hypothetical protein
MTEKLNLDNHVTTASSVLRDTRVHFYAQFNKRLLPPSCGTLCARRARSGGSKGLLLFPSSVQLQKYGHYL